MDPGRVVILNGASSTGKTSIIECFRAWEAVAGDFWLVAAIDDVLARLPSEWNDVGWPGGPGRFADDGLRVVSGASGTMMSVGPLLRRLLRLYQQGVASAARAGFDVIVDEVVLDPTARQDWIDALLGLPVSWVAVRCSAKTMEQRERQRGDRPIGLARAQLATVHTDMRYDMEIDTTFQTAEGAAEVLVRFVSGSTSG